MGAVSNIVKNTFNKIFKKLAEEFKEPVDSIQLGICYTGSSFKYEAYRNFVKEKDILLDDYLNIFESGMSSTIDSTIGQAGPRFAKEFNCNIDQISIIMKYKENELPMAVLMANGEKKRMIDIDTEFLTS